MDLTNFKFEVLEALTTEPISTVNLTKTLNPDVDQFVFEREKARVLVALQWLCKWGYAERADKTREGAFWRKLRSA